MGLILAIEPHLAMGFRNGSVDYLADNDDIIYMAVSRAPYYGENQPRDPFLSRREQVPTIFPWLFVVPAAKITRAVGFPLIRVGLVWRSEGGLLMGFSLFTLFRRLLRKTSRPASWASICALLCLGDAGFAQGRMLVQDLFLAPYLWRGTTPTPNPNAFPLDRVPSPLMVLPWLFLLLAVLSPGRSWSWIKVACAGVLMGICMKLYFFSWTAVVFAAGLWVVGHIIRRRFDRRATEETQDVWPGMKGLTLSMACGFLIGGPQLIDNYQTFRSAELKPILERTGRGQILPSNHPQRRALVKNGWALGKIALGATMILATGWTEYSLLLALTLAGYLLSNSALITGLEFENSHWSMIHTTIGAVMLLAIACRWIDRRIGWRTMFFAPAVLACLFALAWRPFEILHAAETLANSEILRSLAPLRPTLENIGPDEVLAGDLPETNIALLFTQGGQLYQTPYLAHNSLVPDQAVHERYALNAWLLGRDRAEFRRQASTDVDFTEITGLSTRPEWTDAEVIKRRLAAFDSLEAGDANGLMKRHHPDFLLQPTDASPPTRGGTWTKIATSGKWDVWKLGRGSTGRASLAN